MKSILRVACGSYEGSLFGYGVESPKNKESQEEINENNDGNLEANLSFGFHCCNGSLRAIGISGSGRYLACGGSDEVIRIYNMQTNKSAGELAGKHTGTITCLQFYGDSFLLSGSEDNTICIWRVQDWECLHILGGHKNLVNDLSIHPSGKIALSISKDNTLKLWNLIEFSYISHVSG